MVEKDDKLSVSLSEILNMSQSEMVKEAEIDFKKANYAYLHRDNPSKSELERELVITSFDGKHGRAGIIITINGSPPKGMVICINEHGNDWTIDAWNFHRRWERVYSTTAMYNYRTGVKIRLAKATLNLLYTRGLVEDYRQVIK